jgi:rhodanese-related sulfurtransferase
VAKLLFDRGFRKVRPLAGGFEAWRDAGLPLEEIKI